MDVPGRQRNGGLSSWTGGNWHSLPYESTVSVVQRWLYLNAPGGPALQILKINNREKFDPPSFFLLMTSYAGAMKEAGLIKGQPREEREMLGGRASPLLDALFETTLRICPACTEAAYHSFWFQCNNWCNAHCMP